MTAVRYVSSRTVAGKPWYTYQGRITLPARVVTTANLDTITSLRAVGYAEVEVPAATHPDAVRRLLAAEYAAGRWWVFVAGGPGLPPARLTVGVPLHPPETPVPARVTCQE